jgi:hypothetical protein
MEHRQLLMNYRRLLMDYRRLSIDRRWLSIGYRQATTSRKKTVPYQVFYLSLRKNTARVTIAFTSPASVLSFLKIF